MSEDGTRPGPGPDDAEPAWPGRAERERTAAERYKEIVSGLAGAVGSLRARDREREAELVRELAERDRALAAAVERRTVGYAMAELRWEAAVEALWGEEVQLRPRPRPDLRADPDALTELENAADTALEELRNAKSWRLFGRGG